MILFETLTQQGPQEASAQTQMHNLNYAIQ